MIIPDSMEMCETHLNLIDIYSINVVAYVLFTTRNKVLFTPCNKVLFAILNQVLFATRNKVL